MRMPKPVKLYIFDADGTLRRTTVEGQPCPNKEGEWELLPGVRERLAQIEWGERGAHFGVASNQGGVGMRYMAYETAYKLLWEMAREALGREPAEGAIQMCPHAPFIGCPCRKPKPLMLVRLMRRYGLGPDETLFVGDIERDEEAARRAGVRFEWAHEFFGWSAPRPSREEEEEETQTGIA